MTVGIDNKNNLYILNCGEHKNILLTLNIHHYLIP
jgi:hypothetical protein